ncbi:AI-2E family transporter YdiK [Azonexus sp.]|uniref:AI-2E family transporter YdiK n=1 Tax=Azonexus sp. TaxID=1872668 RepID=UPI0039E41809
MHDIRRDLTRNVLAISCVAGLIALSVWVLRPFLAAGVWAAMIVVATWPPFLVLEERLGKRRSLAIVLMCLGMLFLLVLPLWLAIDTLLTHTDDIAALGKRVLADGIPPPPEWLTQIPVLGEMLTKFWRQAAENGAQQWLGQFSPYASNAGKWLLGQVGSLGGLLLQFFLIITLAAIFYATGEDAARLMQRFGRRLAGVRGENAVHLASGAIRGVALGVGVTALVQAALGGIGLAVAGVPLAALLAALMLMLCIAQVGPLVVLLPATAWLFWLGDTGWAVFLAVWSVVVGTLDNFLRPILIRRGANLPLLLIFAGVIGGLLGFGLVGIFVGPVVLAITWTLLQAWIADALGADEEAETETESAALLPPDAALEVSVDVSVEETAEEKLSHS